MIQYTGKIFVFFQPSERVCKQGFIEAWSTCDFEVLATSGDLINVSGTAPNLANHDIVIKDTAGTVINLGDGSAGKNKLTSVSYSGGDTGGGNATVSYSFSNFNVLTVQGG